MSARPWPTPQSSISAAGSTPILASILGYRLRRRVVLNIGALVAVVAALAFGVLSQLTVILILGGPLQLMFILLSHDDLDLGAGALPHPVRALGTGAAVRVTSVSASLIPLLAGAIFNAGESVGMFVLVAAIYAVMAVAVRLGPETQEPSLEHVSGAGV